MCNYNKKNNFLKERYLELSKDKEISKKKYLSNQSIYNNTTGEVFEMDYDLQSYVKNQYIQFVLYTLRLQKQYKDTHTGFFLTNTLQSHYHQFITHKKGKPLKTPIFNKKYTSKKNYKYDKDLDSNFVGYKHLNDIHRDIYKNFRINRTPIKIPFISVVEPHKSFVPHSHNLYFIENEYVEEFKIYVKRLIKNNKELGSFDLVVIDDYSKSVPYLLKYIKKSQNTTNKDELHILDGWKKKHHIQQFKHSNISLPKYIFSKVYRVLSKIENFDNLEDENLLDIIENMVDVDITTLDEKGGFINEKHFIGSNEDNKYKVSIIKEKTTKKVFNLLYSNEVKDIINNDIKSLYLNLNMKFFKRLGEIDRYDGNSYFQQFVDYFNKHHFKEWLNDEDDDFIYKYKFQPTLRDIIISFCNENMIENSQYSILSFVISKDDEVFYNSEDYSLLLVAA